MELRLVAEGAAVEEGRGLEVGAVPRVLALAYRTRAFPCPVTAGTCRAAIVAGDGVKTGGAVGGASRFRHQRAVADDAARFDLCRSLAGIFRGAPCRPEPGDTGDRGAGAAARRMCPHGPGLLDLAGSLRLEAGLGVERLGEGLGALGGVAGELAGLEPQRLDDRPLHGVDLAGDIAYHPARLGPVVVGAVAAVCLCRPCRCQNRHQRQHPNAGVAHSPPHAGARGRDGRRPPGRRSPARRRDGHRLSPTMLRNRGTPW